MRLIQSVTHFDTRSPPSSSGTASTYVQSRKLVGHKDIRTTMIYLHAVDEIGLGVRSPLDRPDGAK